MAKKKKALFGSSDDANESGSSEEIKSVKENTLNAFEAFKALINQKNTEDAPAPTAAKTFSAKEAPQESEAIEFQAEAVDFVETDADFDAENSNSEMENSEEPLAAAASESAEEVEAEESQENMEALSEDSASEDSEEENDELAEFGSTNIFTEEEPASFLPDADEAELAASEDSSLPDVESVEGTELDAFESADIEEVEFVEEEQLDSIVESVLFASDRPVSLNSLKLVFKGTNIRGDKIRRALDRLAVELAGSRRGVTLEEVPGGYQLRTKVDNLEFLTRTLKARQFKLSGPALEVLAIVAYKQPVIKHEIDEIRGVESGHLLRALMEKGLVNFEGKSDLPGKPMLYATTKKFLEIFGLRNLKELPTLSQIDELLPEGMTEEEAKPTLGQVADGLAQGIGSSYSEGEEELMKITDQLGGINTSSEFFEQEKLRQQQKRDAEKAQNIRDAMMMGEEVPTRDRNWLTKYDEALASGNLDQFNSADKPAPAASIESASEVQMDLEAAQMEEEFSADTVADSDAELIVDAEEEPHSGDANL
jgi:segregation and condensation protein B